MKFILSLVLMVSAWSASAEESFPQGCKPLAAPKESVMLSTKNPLLILIHNSSETDLWVTHPISDPGASAGWTSHLQQGKWSALALDSKSFELSCIESKPGHEQQIPCTGLLKLCQWSSVTMPKQTTGTFWAGENMSLSALTSHLGGRGFGLPEPSENNQ